jgi:hypothetical protein
MLRYLFVVKLLGDPCNGFHTGSTLDAALGFCADGWYWQIV